MAPDRFMVLSIVARSSSHASWLPYETGDCFQLRTCSYPLTCTLPLPFNPSSPSSLTPAYNLTLLPAMEPTDTETTVIPDNKATKTRQLARLPTEIVLLILIHLDHHTLLAATASCRQWHLLARDYRQYIWRHLALRDFSFTAARGLWKLDFLKDKDLRACFPPQRPHSPSRSRPRHVHGQQNALTKRGSHLVHPTSFIPPFPSSALPSFPDSRSPKTTISSLYRSGNTTSRTGSELAPICASCWASLQKQSENTGMQKNTSQKHHTPLNEGSGVDQSLADKAQGTSIIPAISFGESECTGEAQQETNSVDNNNTKISLLSYGNCASCLQRLDRKGKRRADDDMPNSQEFVMSDLQCKDYSCSEEQDWKALYQMTSNWYRGRAKGYCPLMLPSLTTLASATRVLSDRSGLGLGPDSGSNPGTRTASGAGSGTTAGAGSADTTLPSPCTPAQVAIQRLLKKRKPVAVIGLQHEGSSLTAVSLAKVPVDPGAEGQATELSRIQLLRSNPHYREKKSPSTGTSIASTSESKPPNPNIMMQDPRRHENVSFAIRTATPPPATTTEDNGVDESDVTIGLETDQQYSSTSSIPLLQTSGQPTLSDLANDILCHYSSPLHSFLVTGHMDGIVRLWDLSVQEPGRQCIRYWQTGPRRRVLCVGMNSKVVVCGNVVSYYYLNMIGAEIPFEKNCWEAFRSVANI